MLLRDAVHDTLGDSCAQKGGGDKDRQPVQQQLRQPGTILEIRSQPGRIDENGNGAGCRNVNRLGQVEGRKEKAPHRPAESEDARKKAGQGPTYRSENKVRPDSEGALYEQINNIDNKKRA